MACREYDNIVDEFGLDAYGNSFDGSYYHFQRVSVPRPQTEADRLRIMKAIRRRFEGLPRIPEPGEGEGLVFRSGGGEPLEFDFTTLLDEGRR